MIRAGLIAVSARAKSAGGLDLALRYNPVVRREIRAAILQCRTPNSARLHQILESLTHRAIEQACRTRYGRGRPTNLPDWPILHKEQVRDRPRDFVRLGLMRVPASTGGTTGLPLRLSRSLRSIAVEQTFMDDLLAPHGLCWAGARIAVLRGDTIKPIGDTKPPFGKATHWAHRLILSSSHLTATSVDWYLDRLRDFQPDMLFSFPANIANLLMLLVQAHRRLHVPLVVTSSARLDGELYNMIAQELGASVIDYYGLAERSALAVRDGLERWHFEPAYGRVELIASDQDMIAEGLRHVRIIATGYWNSAQPLIRYDTGDHAIVPAASEADDLAAIADGRRPFLGIAGRDNEFIFTPDGRRIAGLNMISREVRHVLQVQLVQEALDRLTVRVLAMPQFDRANRDKLLDNVRSRIPSSTTVDIEVADRLETTSRGKAPFIIRHIAAPYQGPQAYCGPLTM